MADYHNNVDPPRQSLLQRIRAHMARKIAYKKLTKAQAKSLPVFPKRKFLPTPPVKKFYKHSDVTPSGDCKLEACFSYTDPFLSAEAIVNTYKNKCGRSAKPNDIDAKELVEMIAAAITGAVDSATGRSAAYRNVREAVLQTEKEFKKKRRSLRGAKKSKTPIDADHYL